MDIFSEILKTKTLKEISKDLCVSKSTLDRWILKNEIPKQYIFDLMKMNNQSIDYTLFDTKLKDQFFTPKETAIYCYKKFIEITDINIEDFIFVEPSAGNGDFLDILPKNGRIGLDIEPRNTEIVKMDYLDWLPTNDKNKFVVIGNPPFGLRGHTALQFINHSSIFAEYVCFILPQLFESNGKGVPRKRVIGLNLIYSEKLDTDFYEPSGKKIKINCIFQIWSKKKENEKYSKNTNTIQNVRIYSLSDGDSPGKKRNKKMIGKCHIYLPSTCFGICKMKYYNSFEELPNNRGYGLFFSDNKNMFVEKVKSIEWNKVSFLSTNGALNLNTELIIKQLK